VAAASAGPCAQVCTSLQTDNHASTHRSVFYRPDALPAAQPTASTVMRYDSDANKAYQRARIPGGFLPFELRVVGGVSQFLQLAEYLVRVVVVVFVVLVSTQNQSHALGRGRRRYKNRLLDQDFVVGGNAFPAV